ncbi:MAG: hypothetical protein K2X77_23310 [Candidatus Obscuribacterales bacterium]|jgi:hypothetical protein|nr:hypothetical protein [Candidatus Obscuribacterales bacterium]
MQGKNRFVFVNLDGEWDSKGVIAHVGQILIICRDLKRDDKPGLQELRLPWHCFKQIKGSLQTAYLPGQPKGTEALYAFEANCSAGGLLIARFGELSPIPCDYVERSMGVTIYP